MLWLSEEGEALKEAEPHVLAMVNKIRAKQRATPSSSRTTRAKVDVLDHELQILQHAWNAVVHRMDREDGLSRWSCRHISAPRPRRTLLEATTSRPATSAQEQRGPRSDQTSSSRRTRTTAEATRPGRRTAAPAPRRRTWVCGEGPRPEGGPCRQWPGASPRAPRSNCIPVGGIKWPLQNPAAQAQRQQGVEEPARPPWPGDGREHRHCRAS